MLTINHHERGVRGRQVMQRFVGPCNVGSNPIDRPKARSLACIGESIDNVQSQ